MLADYEKYAKESLKNFSAREREKRLLLFNSVKDRPIGRVLDLGCGAGHELLPFLENTDALCFGVDSGESLGSLTQPLFADFRERTAFVRSTGELLPFDDDSFDVIICRVSLPYMDNRRAVAEIGRILKPGGALLLKTHAPLFYLWLLYARLKTFSPRQVAYPVICIIASIWNSLTGRQLSHGIWRGKEIYQTRGFLKEEFGKSGVVLEKELPDSSNLTPSALYTKHPILRGFVFLQLICEILAVF